jgi:hypothetical protein
MALIFQNGGGGGGTPLADGNLTIKNGLPIDGTLQTVSDVVANDSALQISTDEVGISKSATAITQDTAVLRSSDTNAGIAIVPNGTGAITAQVPDATVAGGNARGTNAVDLQTIRGVNTQVAGSQAVIVGGASNTAAGTQSVVVGGQSNRANTLQSFIGGGNSNSILTAGENAIVGGTLNTNNGVYGFIGAGLQNTVSSSYSIVSGGQSNTASTGSHATVVGGSNNTSSGQYSISGGENNTASGYGAMAIGGGASNVASAFGTIAIGGATASGTRMVAIGRGANASGFDGGVAFSGGQVIGTGGEGLGACAFGRSKTTSIAGFSFGEDSLSYLRNQFVQSPINIYGGNTNYVGHSQASQVVAVRQATLNSAATTVLSLDGTGTTNLIIPTGNNRLWAAKVTATAFVNAVSGTTLVLGDSYMGEYTILFKKVGGVSSVVGVTGGAVISDTNMSTSAFNFSAGASQELSITFVAPTTANADTFRCVAKVELVEVAY